MRNDGSEIRRSADWWRWGIAVLFACGVAYSQLQTLPKLDEKVADHEHRITVVESKMDDIKESLHDIKRILQPRPR